MALAQGPPAADQGQPAAAPANYYAAGNRIDLTSPLSGDAETIGSANATPGTAAKISDQTIATASNTRGEQRRWTERMSATLHISHIFPGNSRMIAEIALLANG